jgi:hypothetical protein
MASIPLPALSVRGPEPGSTPLQNYASLASLLGAQQERQQRQNEIQLQQLKIKEVARQQQENEAIRKSFVANNGDVDAVVKDVSQNPVVSPQTLQQLQLHSLDFKTKLDAKSEADLKLHSTQVDNLIGAFRPVFDAPDDQKPALWQQQRAKVMSSPQAYGVSDASSIPEVFPGKAQGEFLMASLQGATKQLEDAKTRALTAEATGKAGQATAETQKAQAQIPGIQAESQAKSKFALPQAQAELGKTRAQTAEALASTAKTTAETENLGQLPVFAVDPQTNQRVMTTRPEAQAKGYTNVVPVKEGDVQKQTDAVAMTNDVQLNVSRYRAAMNRMYQEPMNGKQMAALTALTPEKLGIDIGHGFGFNLPDVIQKITNASAFSVLSPTQKQAMLGYYTTLASVPAAQKALTGIGRSNKEMLDLELRTIPTPLMDHETFNLGMERFQGNVTQTAAKNVRIPGMPTTLDIRNQIEGPQPVQLPQINFQVPKPMGVPLSSLLGQ